MMEISINIGLIVMYLLLAAAVLALLFFSLKFMITSIGKSKTTLFGIGGFVGLFLVSYLFSSSTDVSLALFEKTGTDPGISKIVGSGLIFTYLMFFAVVASLIYAAISKMLK
jgi:hypothetical protein